MPLKVGVVGCGFVGSTAAYAMVQQGVGREIVLVDMKRERSLAEAQDISHAIPFSRPLKVRAGEYSDLQGCRVVVIAAGVGQKPGETRLQLLERNANVFRAVVPAVVQAAPDAVLLIATNPVDIMTHIAAHFAAQLGVPRHRVLGSGTTLDTARFRTLLSDHFGVDSHHVHGYVIGEHGDSEVLTWSQATIGGMHLADFARLRGIPYDEAWRQQVDQGVRRAAYTIIEGKGATYYGIGAALARIVDVILHDQRAILTVSTFVNEFPGVTPATFALPHLVGGDGVLGCIPLQLSDEESTALQRSAQIIADATESVIKHI
ncbi:L-lactate dehydrogenase [Anatilimnocola floriformis]|uniref:L-lactate dehydrogenase n=1 Tax=Anatilimnocola floriformis TaxID=2948575 RepID=UPI0020C27247|nr:L-lactate dehydrogenase [Anatilimnocola floriformis]